MPLAAPNQTDFTTFLYGTVGIPTAALPSTSSVIPMALQISLDIVNQALTGVPDLYTLAVYNLGADNVIRFASDQPGQTYFATMRQTLGVNAFAPGLTSSTGDEGTSESLLNPEFMSKLTLMDLQNLKTPWGRQYLAFAQMYGPSVWGLS